MGEQAKKANSLILRASYNELDQVIWRDYLVKLDMCLNELAYLILVSFDTMAQHLYLIDAAGEEFSEGDWDEFAGNNARTSRIADLGLHIGDTFSMEYDMGIGHRFNIRVIGENTEPGEVNAPLIIDGRGCGIIDEQEPMDLISYIDQIDLIGKTTEPIYYKDRTVPWDYRNLDLVAMNASLRSEMKAVEKAYRGKN